jgi:hypothetical protein
MGCVAVADVVAITDREVSAAFAAAAETRAWADTIREPSPWRVFQRTLKARSMAKRLRRLADHCRARGDLPGALRCYNAVAELLNATSDLMLAECRTRGIELDPVTGEERAS